MTRVALWILPLLLLTGAAPDKDVEFLPISHATLVVKLPGTTLYVDPVGTADAFTKFSRPDVILITHIHQDHLDVNLVKKLKQSNTAIIGPKVVIEKLGEGLVMGNGDKKTVGKIEIEAIPAYNTTKERLRIHPRGRDNGYVLTAGRTRIYISGDTEDIKELRALKDIDYAFICMNVPYTMSEEQAASAVLEMKPKVVFPYHYRGRPNFGDTEKFKRLVAKDPNIEVRVLKWY